MSKAQEFVGALGLILLTTLLPIATSPAMAADEPEGLLIRISRITPSVLQPGDDLAIVGVIHNPGRRSWSDVRAYPAVAANPFVSRVQVQAAIANGPGYAGARITSADASDNLGTLRAGESRSFALTIQSEDLPMSGADGVYGIGVHAIATDPDGNRTDDPVGRANSLLPVRAAAQSEPAPTTVLWPFLLPGQRDAGGRYAGTADLAARIAPRGQLRNLLDLARSTPRRGSDVLIDPSLLQVVQDLSRTPGDTPAARELRENATEFLDDLVDLSENYACAAVGFDQPDVVAVALSPATPDLNALVRRATDETLDIHDLDCMRVEWPSPRGIDRPTVSALRSDDVDAVIVSPWAVPGWDGSDGNVLETPTATGEMPLLVTDRLDRGAPGVASIMTLRQNILSEAVFVSMAAGAETSDTATVVLVSPQFNPGAISGKPLAAVYGSRVTEPKNLAETVRERRQPFVGEIPEAAEDRSLGTRLMTIAADAAQTAQLLDGMLLDDSAKAQSAQRVARLLSERWRGHAATGLRAAEATSSQLLKELAAISIDGPEALTLSSGAGQFPVTVGNKTPHRVRVGLAFESTAPGVRFTAPPTVDVAAGESRTVTVNIDMRAEPATTVTARLTAAQGEEFGAATDFNVRSSQVGAALWVAIGVSVAFVAIALVRRFARPGHRPEHPTLPPEDFDD